MSDHVQVEIEDLGSTQRNLKITVGLPEVEAAMKSALGEVRKKANIKGFRKGKAPERVILKNYQSEIQSEAIYSLLDSSYVQALDICGDLKIVGQPSIKDIDFNEGKPFHYIAQVEILPEIPLEKYKGLEITLLEEKVGQDQIDEQLQKIQESQSRLVPLTEARAVKMDDCVIVDMEAVMDAQPLPEASGQGVTIEMGKMDFIPGFEGAMLGMMPGEDKHVDLNFAEDHPHYPGKPIHFHIKVLEIKTKEMPELNDEFAKDLGGEFKSLQELTERIEEDLKSAAEDRSKQYCRAQILDNLVEINDFDLPDVMVDHEVKQMLEETKRNMQQQQMPAPSDEELSQYGLEIRGEAEKRVRAGLLLEAVMKKEKVEVLDEDIERYLGKIAKRVGKEVDELKKIYEHPKAKESLTLNLLEEKTLEFLKEKAKIVKRIQDLNEFDSDKEAVVE